MSVKALTACGPRCFRCLLDMPSGPVEEVFFVARIASVTIAGVKGGDLSVLVHVYLFIYLFIYIDSLQNQAHI